MKSFTTLTVLLFCTTYTLSAFQPAPVPEPGTMILVGGGLAAAILITRARRRRK